MTNEQIRKKIYKECPVNTWQTVDNIQIATRKDERNRIIKLITQMDEFSVSNYKVISPEIMSLRDKIIERIREC